jgi:hypothetical protein
VILGRKGHQVSSPDETWSPSWELCEQGQCDIFTGDGNWHTVFPVLQRARTEDVMAVEDALVLKAFEESS